MIDQELHVEDVLTEDIIQYNPEKGSNLILDYNSETEKMVVTIESEKKKKTRKKKSEE